MGPAWLVAGPGQRDSLAAVGQEPPVAALPVAVPPVAVPPVAGRVVGAAIPLVVLVIVVAAAAAAAAPTNLVVVFPTQPEIVVRRPVFNEPVKKKKTWRTCIASCCACC